MSKQIPIRGKHADMVVTVSDEDYADVSRFNWYVTQTHSGMRYVLNKNLGYLHRYIADKFLPNNPALPVVDHKNKDTGCCERWNLRRCTMRDNLRNRGKHKTKKAHNLFKGVHHNGHSYVAHIKSDYEELYLGSHKRLFDAVLAYDTACYMLHGEFASPNCENMTEAMINALANEFIAQLGSQDAA